jgi:zinc transporter, ZIP family
VTPTQVTLLGAIAGATIFLGLPLGRIRAEMPRTRALLNALATGILVFLLWDVLTHAWEPIDAGLAAKDPGSVAGLAVVFASGITVGLLSLVYFDRWVAARSATVASASSPGPGAASVAELGARPLSTARSLALMIAVGIGLHNFAEGLAIGNSAADGELQLAVLLVIGFAAHNATEGFGIVAPMAAARVRPSWGYLILLGVIGGGPTMVGTIVGQQFTSDVMSVAFLTLAAGSILYVVIELSAVSRRYGMKVVTTWGLLAGLLLGFATDAIVSLAGA